MDRKVVYVAGPFRASNQHGSQDMFKVQQNIMRAMELGLEVWKLGHVALIPHSNTMFFTGASGCADEVWLAGDLELIKRCDAVLMTPDWSTSRGATAELKFAESLGIPVFYTVDDVRCWLAQAA